MRNPFREIKRLRTLVGYYEDHMMEQIRCQKYKEQGCLLLANAAPGDRIFLIGASLAELFDDIKECIVEKVYFTGGNDAVMVVRADGSNNRYRVRNKQFGRLFFTNSTEAYMAWNRRMRIGEKNEIFCCNRRG